MANESESNDPFDGNQCLTCFLLFHPTSNIGYLTGYLTLGVHAQRGLL